MIAWHYTTGRYFIEIVQSGFLDPSKTVTPPRERAIVWFSTNQYFEPTAQKALSQGATIVFLGMDGTFEHGGGLVRFGIKATDMTLKAWPKLGVCAGMHPQTIAAIEAVGREQGANPAQWLGSFKRIAVKRMTICVAERLNDGFKWVEVQS